MNMKIYFTKNAIFSTLLILVSMLIIVRITPVTVDPVIKLVISKNRSSITNIHQQRDIESVIEIKIDRLNLLHNGRFGHPKLGNIATYSDDFFVDVDHKITVKKADTYRFLGGSDDGFYLNIDGKQVCEHQGDRPYAVQPCLIFLNEGEHQVRASYFQGFGNSGFTLEYARGEEKQQWFGDDSASVKF